MYISNILKILLFVLPNIFFVWLVYSHAINIPFFDDIDAIGLFLLKSEDSSFLELIRLISAQYAEHRIGFTRIIALISTMILGEVDFKFLTTFGSLGLCACLLFLQSFTDIKLKGFLSHFLYIIPISLIVLNLQYYENLTTAMTSLQNNNAPLFGILAIYCLVKSKNNLFFFASMILGFIALFTSGNGIIILILGIVILVVIKLWKKSLIWFGYAMSLLVLYFQDFHSLPNQFGGRTSITTLLESPFKSLYYECLVVASSFEPIRAYLPVKYGQPFLGFLGVIMLVYCFWYIYRAIIKEKTDKNLVLAFVISFILLTTITLTLLRASNIENMFISRYRIYSSLLVALILITLSDILSKPYHKYLLFIYVVIGGVFLIFDYDNYPNFCYHNQNMRASLLTYKLNNAWLGLYPTDLKDNFTDQVLANQVTEQMSKEGIYKLPNEINEDQEIKKINATIKTQVSTDFYLSNKTKFIEDEDNLQILIDSISYTANKSQYPPMVFLKQNNSTIFYSAQKGFHNFKYLLLTRGASCNNFRACIQKNHLKQAKYQIVFLYPNENEYKVIWIGQRNMKPSKKFEQHIKLTVF